MDNATERKHVTQQNFPRKNTLTRHPKVFNMNREAVLKPKDQAAVKINRTAARVEANKEQLFVKQPVNSKIPEDLVCGWCKCMVREAVWTPCCSKCYCSNCIEVCFQLSNNECCGCNTKNLSMLKLIPAEDLRQRADTIRMNVENSKPEKAVEGSQKSPLKIKHPKVEKSRKLSLDLDNRRSPAAIHTTSTRKRPRSRSNSPVYKRTFRYSPSRRHSRRSSSRSPSRSPTQKRTSAATTRASSWHRRGGRSRSPVRNPSPPPRQDNRSSFIDLPNKGCKRKEKRTHSLTSTKSSSSSDSDYSKRERRDKNNEKRRKSKD